ncbi:unnamed protein product [Rotaria sp. Silwood2]|nr:unnamed protein product [Rotaria sp. Silwood2]
MEKVRQNILKINVLQFLYSILKDEYTHTHFKTISKSQFPSLLKRLWTHDPIGTQTNLVKSFIKAGIFPFNPNSIDRTRILKNKTNVDKRISSVPTNSAHDNQTTTINIPSSHQATNSSFTSSDQTPSSSFTSAHQATASSFTSSRQAIATLDRVLKETQLINSDIEDLNDDEDEKYCPSESSFTLSISVSSDKQQKSQSDQTLITKNNRSILLQQEKKRKKNSSSIIGFDTSEDDDAENLDLPRSTSQQLFRTKHELQPKKVLPSKHHQATSSEEQKKRMKLAFKTVGFDTSDEDVDVVPNLSTSNPQTSLQAITDAIQNVFSTPSNKTSKQRSKRTVLNRSNGQIITEKIVIEQLEERKNKQKFKRSGSNSRITNEKKRKRQQKNGHQGHFIVSSSQRSHSISNDDITEHEDFTNDTTTKIVQRRHKRKQVQIHAHNYNTRQNANRQSNSRTTAVQFDSTQLNQSIQSTQFIQSNQKQTETMTVSTFNNDQLTEEAERFARTRYPFPPFIVRFPSSNIKE